jgi:hypothetical protein
MTLNVHPCEFGFVSEGLKAIISAGVVYSLPGQKGQKPPFFQFRHISSTKKSNGYGNDTRIGH